MKVNMLCCSGECISFPLIQFNQEWFQSAWEFLHKEHNRNCCEFISGPSRHLLNTFPTLSTLLLPVPFLLPHNISLCLPKSLPPWLTDCQHMPVLVWSCQSAQRSPHMHILTEASQSCLLKWMGLWIMAVPPLVHTAEHWILFSS